VKEKRKKKKKFFIYGGVDRIFVVREIGKSREKIEI